MQDSDSKKDDELNQRVFMQLQYDMHRTHANTNAEENNSTTSYQSKINISSLGEVMSHVFGTVISTLLLPFYWSPLEESLFHGLVSFFKDRSIPKQSKEYISLKELNHDSLEDNDSRDSMGTVTSQNMARLSSTSSILSVYDSHQEQNDKLDSPLLEEESNTTNDKSEDSRNKL